LHGVLVVGLVGRHDARLAERDVGGAASEAVRDPRDHVVNDGDDACVRLTVVNDGGVGALGDAALDAATGSAATARPAARMKAMNDLRMDSPLGVGSEAL